jgi:hypothetical protein
VSSSWPPFGQEGTGGDVGEDLGDVAASSGQCAHAWLVGF